MRTEEPESNPASVHPPTRVHPTDLTGATLGKYRLIEKLGQGGMAQACQAYQPDLNCYVAIKVLHPHLTGNEEFAARFHREARAIAALEHLHLVRIYDFATDPDLAFIVMEYLTGVSLKAHLRALNCHNELMPLTEVAHIIGALTGAKLEAPGPFQAQVPHKY